VTSTAPPHPQPRLRIVYPPGTSLSGHLSDIDVSEAQLTDFRPDNATFTNFDFTNTRFGLGNITDVVFTDCDFTGATFLGTRVVGASFVRCVLTRTTFESASLRAVTTQDCDFSRAVLYDSYVDESFPTPHGYVRSTVPLSKTAPDLAKIYIDAHALRSAAVNAGVDPDTAIDLLNEHRDIAPCDLFAMFAAIKA
jgi:hypothetical protein